MNFLFILIILIFTFAGVVMVIVGLPGTFMVWVGVFICSLIDGFELIKIKLLVILFLLAIVGEILEFISGVVGAKKFGASGKGIIGAVMGGMAGAVLLTAVFPGIGTIIGVMAGTFLGAFLGEYVSGKDVIASSRAGWGAFLGRVAAVGIKVLIILAMSSISISKYFNQ